MDNNTRSQREFLVQLAYLAAIGGLFYIAFRFLLVWLMPFVLGYAIALMVRPAVGRLSNCTGLGPRASGRLVILAAYALLILLLFLAGSALRMLLDYLVAWLPLLYRETLLPAAKTLEELLQGRIGALLPTGGVSLERLLQNAQSALLEHLAGAVGWLGSTTAKLPLVLLTLLFTVMCSLLISTDYQKTSRFLAAQIPKRHRHILFSLKRGTGEALWGYCKAYLLLGFITFCELSVGLGLLGVQRFLPLAAFIAVLDLLPVLGTGVVLIPWALVSYLQGNTPTALGLLCLYGVALTVHSLLEPRLVSRQMGLHPLAGICAVYLGFRLQGVAGMVLAPILLQLAVGLHRAGIIQLWQEPEIS